MRRYIFLDNWVFHLLRNPGFETGLREFLKSRDLIVLLTPLSMIELYNPGWSGAKGGNERGAAATQFLGSVPCVIVDPWKVRKEELAAHLDSLHDLPLNLDLADIPATERGETLLKFLRRDEVFLQQGRDIQTWSLEYAEFKRDWLSDVDRIIESACLNGNLKRDKRGKLIELESHRELFLFSLDCRQADPKAVDAILRDYSQRFRSGTQRLTAVRLSSLCFWYSYIEIDKAKQHKRQGSDIGDFNNISLSPYCSMFTVDGAMSRMLQRVHGPAPPVKCELITKSILEEQVSRFT